MSNANQQPESNKTSMKQSLSQLLSSGFKLVTPIFTLRLFSVLVRFFMARVWLTGVTSVCALLAVLVMNFGPETTKSTPKYDYTNGRFEKFKQSPNHPLSSFDERLIKKHENDPTTLAGAKKRTSTSKRRKQAKSNAPNAQLVEFSKPVSGPTLTMGATQRAVAESSMRVTPRSQTGQTGQTANGPMMLRAPASNSSVAPLPQTARRQPAPAGNEPAAWLTGSIEFEVKPTFESAQPKVYNGPIIRSAEKRSRPRQ